MNERKRNHDPHIMDKIMGIALFLGVGTAFIVGMLALSAKTVVKPKPKTEPVRFDKFKFPCVKCGQLNEFNFFDVIDTTHLTIHEKTKAL